LLAAVLLPALSAARGRARRTACMSNLRQLGTSWTIYMGEFDQQLSPWLSTLHPTQLPSTEVYHCPDDRHQDGTAANAWLSRPDGDFSEAYDRPGSIGHHGNDPNPSVTNISMFYESSEASCSWTWTGAPPSPTWGEVKLAQMACRADSIDPSGTVTYSNPCEPYATTEFPVIRCFWHIKDIVRVLQPGQILSETNSVPVLNIGFAGNVFTSQPHWEEGQL